MPAPVIAVKVGLHFLQTKQGRALIAGILAVVMLLLVGGAIGGVVLITSTTSLIAAAQDEEDRIGDGKCEASAGPEDDSPKPPANLTDEKIANARIIIGVAKSLSFSAPTTDVATPAQLARHASIIAMSTALVESQLINVNQGDRDSLGLFQQRPSAGWGNPAQLTDPVYAAAAFYHGIPGKGVPGLLDKESWYTRPPGQVAQDVQRSAHPDRYAQRMPEARWMVEAEWENSPAIPVPDVLHRPLVMVPPSQAGPIGDSTCPPESGDFTGPVTHGPWGEPPVQNGLIPHEMMCSLPWAPHHRLRCDAQKALVQMNEAFKLEFGYDIGITDAYRTYEEQVRLKAEKGHMAATPGKSNHGWGLALDLGTGINRWDTPQHNWMKTHARKFGWNNPAWAQKGKGKEEPWHWEYVGITDGS